MLRRKQARLEGVDLLAVVAHLSERDRRPSRQAPRRARRGISVSRGRARPVRRRHRPRARASCRGSAARACRACCPSRPGVAISRRPFSSIFSKWRGDHRVVGLEALERRHRVGDRLADDRQAREQALVPLALGLALHAGDVEHFHARGELGDQRAGFADFGSADARHQLVEERVGARLRLEAEAVDRAPVELADGAGDLVDARHRAGVKPRRGRRDARGRTGRRAPAAEPAGASCNSSGVAAAVAVGGWNRFVGHLGGPFLRPAGGRPLPAAARSAILDVITVGRFRLFATRARGLPGTPHITRPRVRKQGGNGEYGQRAL